MQLAKYHSRLKRNQQLARGITPDTINEDVVGRPMAEQNLRSMEKNPQRSYLNESRP